MEEKEINGLLESLTDKNNREIVYDVISEHKVRLYRLLSIAIVNIIAWIVFMIISAIRLSKPDTEYAMSVILILSLIAGDGFIALSVLRITEYVQELYECFKAYKLLEGIEKALEEEKGE